MIATVSGLVADLRLDSAVVEVGGVGILTYCTPTTLAELRVGTPVCLHTTMIVREDSLALYGFSSSDERRTFEILMTASGVGPRLALGRRVRKRLWWNCAIGWAHRSRVPRARFRLQATIKWSTR